MNTGKLTTGFCIAALGLALAACEPIKSDQGYHFDAEQVAQLQAGVTTKDMVQEIMGSPSAITTFQTEGDAWYYISSKTEHLAFFAKEVTEREILVVKFDLNDVVSELEGLDLTAGEEVQLVERETPTGGRKLGLLEQLFGNLGRFNQGGEGQ
ncbi:MAG TPA: outer membrane protein assembly factor BamE [Oceanicaulis sp.]|nr:outer membrane protein assembly factor BamE [Oceanicaulis sp.]